MEGLLSSLRSEYRARLVHAGVDADADGALLAHSVQRVIDEAQGQRARRHRRGADGSRRRLPHRGVGVRCVDEIRRVSDHGVDDRDRGAGGRCVQRGSGPAQAGRVGGASLSAGDGRVPGLPAARRHRVGLLPGAVGAADAAVGHGRLNRAGVLRAVRGDGADVRADGPWRWDSRSGSAAWSEEAANGFTNVFSLVVAFTGGAWFPASMMPEAMLVLGHLLPGWWYGGRVGRRIGIGRVRRIRP